MKRVFALLSLFLLAMQLLMQVSASAAPMYWLNFQSFRDEYRMDFSYPSNTTNYNVHFVGSSNVPYDVPFNNPPTGILYLTCNGTYSVQFFDGATQLAQFDNIVTSAIVTPSCSSYPEMTGTNELNATLTDNGNSNYGLQWDNPAGTAKIEIYKDGQKIGETTGNGFNATGDGAYSIVARNANGDIIGQSDLHAPELGGVEDDAGCDMCDKLSELLACPDWDLYMGELTGAIKAALPTLPEWRAIADQFVDAFDEYFGAVPDAPTQSEINDSLDTTLPTLDSTSSDATSLVPTVPAGYEQPKPFDITSGPEISIVDESQPFEIMNPLHNIEYDAPGVPVMPNDERNNTGGITKPVIHTLPNVNPVPTKPIVLPNDPIPVPTPTVPSNNTGAVPTDIGGTIPIPIYKGG